MEASILLEWMRNDPIAFFTFMLYRAPAVLIALTLHEIAHGYVAYLCGDTTARDRGRLSLNPFRHLSLIGTLLMFTAGMGWAKPVPVNPNNLRHPRRDDFFVSIAGVSVNFMLFTLATLLSIGVHQLLWTGELSSIAPAYTSPMAMLSFRGENFYQILYSEDLLVAAQQGNQYLGVEAASYLQTPWLLHVQRFLYQFALCNLGACLFNLLPFPPLDGFHVFNDILLRGKLKLSHKVFQYSMLALLALSYFTDIFSNYLSRAIDWVQTGMLSALLALVGLV